MLGFSGGLADRAGTYAGGGKAHAHSLSPLRPRLQIERIALTEPVELELPAVVQSLLRAVPTAVRGVGRYASGLGSEAGSRVQSAEEAAKRRPDRWDKGLHCVRVG